MIVVEGDVINNLKEAADWLREAWICEPYNIYYEEIGKKDSEYYSEWISIEPVRGHEDMDSWDIWSLEEFEQFMRHGW